MRINLKVVIYGSVCIAWPFDGGMQWMFPRGSILRQTLFEFLTEHWASLRTCMTYMQGFHFETNKPVVNVYKFINLLHSAICRVSWEEDWNGRPKCAILNYVLNKVQLTWFWKEDAPYNLTDKLVDDFLFEMVEGVNIQPCKYGHLFYSDV